MPIRVKIATTPMELDGLFQARHRVFVEEDGYFKATPNKRIFDQFDAFPTTANFIAMVNKQVVGGLRITERSGVGTPTDDFFDFAPYLPPGTVKTASASMLCVQQDYRNLYRLLFVLISMATYWAISRKISHIVAAINPLITRVVRSVGFQPVASAFRDNKHDVDVLPMLLDLNDTRGHFREMARFQGFHSSLSTFDREIYRTGETIIKCGAEGDAAYVIVDGKVTISRPGRRADDPPTRVLSELGPGEIFGELALLTNKPRPTDAIASTDVDLMVIEQDVFREQLLGNPNLQLKLLELLGQRLSDTMEQFSNR
jgi:N-acyl-L-homoserine lactone synthetase